MDGVALRASAAVLPALRCHGDGDAPAVAADCDIGLERKLHAINKGAAPPASPSRAKRTNAMEEARGVIPPAEAPLEPSYSRGTGQRSDGSDGSSGACVAPSSTPHTVRSLSSGYHFARAKGRANEHGAHAAHGQRQPASGESAARFDVAPPLPDGFLQGRDRTHSFNGSARGAAAASMNTLIQQEKATAAAASAAAATSRSPQPKPNISNENLARFLHTELGSQIFIRHLQSGGYFLKHSSAAMASAAAASTACPEIPAPAAAAAAPPPPPSSSPHWRHVWLSSDLRTVCWGEMTPARTKRPSGHMAVDQILVIFPGHQTRAFTHKQAGSPSRLCVPERCFSLVSPSRTLDLECTSQSECETWVLAFQFLLDHSRTTGGATATATATAAAEGLGRGQVASKALSPSQGAQPSPSEGAPPPNLSLVSALEVLSDLVVLGPTQATYAYFRPGPCPPSPVLSAQSSAHTSACASPAQGDLRRLAMGPGGRSSSGGSTSSAASSVGSTPAFGSPAFTAAQSLAAPSQGGPPASQQNTPGMAYSASAQAQQPPVLSLESLAAAGLDVDSDRSFMTSPPQPPLPQPSPPQPALAPTSAALSQSQVFPGGMRRKSFVNLESLPEAEEDTANSAARAPGTAEQDAPFDAHLVPSTHEPEVGAAPPPALPLLSSSTPVPMHSCLDLQQQPSAPMLQPQPLPSASASPPPMSMSASHMRTSLHSLYMSMQGASSACIGAAALAAVPAMSAAAIARVESDVARLERLLSRERHDHAALRVWVAHRFLHLQSHINSLAIERNKLLRRIQAEADEAEAELEREVARVMGATPSQSSRRLAEARCQSSAD